MNISQCVICAKRSFPGDLRINTANIPPRHCTNTPKSHMQKSIKVLTALVPSHNQPTIQQSFESAKLWNVNDEKAMKIHRKIVRMMALDNQPFSVVEDQGFTDSMKHLQSRYKLANRKYFTEKMLPLEYDRCYSNILKKVTEAEFLSFTSDIWSCDKSKYSFLSITAHWITDDFEPQNAVLRARHMGKSHTGVYISDILQEVFREFSINAERRFLLVRDGASNMRSAADLTNIDNIHCVIHLMQLVIQNLDSILLPDVHRMFQPDGTALT